MLEHLRAEDEVETARLERHRLDEPDDVRARRRLDVEPYVLLRDRLEVRVVRLDAAADVEDADACTRRAKALGLGAQPARESLPHDPLRGRRRRVPPLLAGPHAVSGTWVGVGHATILATTLPAV